MWFEFLHPSTTLHSLSHIDTSFIAHISTSFKLQDVFLLEFEFLQSISITKALHFSDIVDVGFCYNSFYIAISPRELLKDQFQVAPGASNILRGRCGPPQADLINVSKL